MMVESCVVRNVYGIWKVLYVIVDRFVGLTTPLLSVSLRTSETPVDKFHISKHSIVSLKRIQIKA